MKSIIGYVSIITVLFFISNIFVQGQLPPPVTGDKDLRDSDVRMRSVEMERVKREANKGGAQGSLINGEVESKFKQIKEDFEGIQISQAAIVKAYTTGASIDYALIETSAKDVRKRAKRLDRNIFVEDIEIEGGKREKEEKKTAIKDMIVELDNMIGSFVANKMFGNLKVVDQAVAKGAKADLTKIIKLSEKLSQESGKMK